jgi:hypothetical protein
VVSSSFKDASLESTYQRYSHWQRQKLLIVVNVVDVVLKIITVAVISAQYRDSPESSPCPVDVTSSVNSYECYSSLETRSNPSLHGEFPIKTAIWMSCLIFMNAMILLLAFFWKNFTNNHLHLASLATWLLMNFQGKLRLY